MPDRGGDHDLRRLRRGAQRDQLRAERRMVARLDAGRRDLAGAHARPRDRHQPRHLVLRRRARRRHHHVHHRRVGLAHRLRGARRWSRCSRSMCASACRNRPTGCACRIASDASRRRRQPAARCCPAIRPGSTRRRRSRSRQLFLPDMLRQHRGGDVHRLLQHDHLRHGRRLDAALSGAGAALVHRDLRHVLHLVGTGRISRPARGGPDLRPLRTQAGVLRHAGARARCS